jgi:anti-sigma factor RsiW
MKCEEAGRCLDAYLDSELELGRRRELQQHLNICPSCWSLVRERQEFRFFFRASAPTYKAPPELRAKVLAMARQEKPKLAFALLHQPWAYAAAAFVLSLSLALNILFPDVGKEVSRQAVLLHSRSISADHLVDVASADPHVVKSWLTAKLDFSPPVVGLPASGYSLIGGRLDVIQNRQVATVVYKDDKEIVTLFCWPPKKEHLSAGDHFIEGYRACTWSNAECNYILVSKLSDRETDEFVDSFRDHVQSGVYF